MAFLKSLWVRLAAVWALLVFVTTMLLVLLPLAVTGLWKEPKRSIYTHAVFARWMDVFFGLAGVRRIVKGGDHFKKGENYVIVCNHNSFMDATLCSGSIPGANKTIAKIEMSRIPLFGIVYKRGSVLVDRKKEKSRKESFMKMREVLAMGLHMCIYPEGTRNKGAEPLQPFKDGAFRLAVDAGKCVVPAVIFDTRKVLPQGKGLYFLPRPVQLHFLSPVSPRGKTPAALKDEVFDIMHAYYTANR